MEYNIIAEDKGFLLILEGRVTGHDLVSINAELIKHPDYNSKAYQIWDMLHVTSVEFSSDHLRQLAIQDSVASKDNPDMKVALVGKKSALNNTDTIYGIYAEVWDAFTNHTFDHLDEARRWVENSEPDQTNKAV